jgi:hypothetical protein
MGQASPRYNLNYFNELRRLVDVWGLDMRVLGCFREKFFEGRPAAGFGCALVRSARLMDKRAMVIFYAAPMMITTTIFSSHVGQQLSVVPSPPSDFTGFSTFSGGTVHTGADGKLTVFCCHERWIMPDKRATPIQLADSLNFQLYCLTSWRRCKNDRYVLP